MALGGPNIYPGFPSFPSYPYCETCGTELVNRELHEKWHEDLDQRILDLQMEVTGKQHVRES